MRLTTLQHHQHTAEAQIRARICSRCPRRPWEFRGNTQAIAWPCQRTCPIFQMLPTLVERGELLDPMLNFREEILSEAMQWAARSEDNRVRKTLLSRNADEVARIVSALAENG